MNSFPSSTTAQTQQPRQTPRLQNTQKSALGNGLGGWNTAGAGGGFGALGGGLGSGSLGGGLGRQPPLSGFAQVMGGGSGQGPIDMSDFPSLSGGPRPAANQNAVGGWNSNAIRQISSQQQPPPQQSQAQQQQRPSSTAPSQHSLDQYDGQRSQQASVDRAEDAFPPLGGQLNADSLPGQSNGFSSSITSPDSTQPRSNGQQSQLPIRGLETSASFANQHQAQSQQAPIGSGSQPAAHQPTQNGQDYAEYNGQAQQPPSSQPQPQGKKYANMSPSEQYGLTGLLAGFEARRQADQGQPIDDTLPSAMRNNVMMGQDLSTLGLELDNPEPMHTTFSVFPATDRGNGSGSYFDFHERCVVPDFHLPAAYTVGNVPDLERRMGAFSDETLFSIFFQNPRDILQELAAIELTGRDWRWHKVLRQWLQKDTLQNSTSTSTSGSGSSLQIVDLAPGMAVGAAPIRVGERSERGVYVFFDAANWRRERREFVLDYGELDHRNVGANPQSGMVNGMSGGGIGPAPGLGAGGPVQPPSGMAGMGGAPGLSSALGGGGQTSA